MNLQLIHAGRYTHVQAATQITNAAFLSLNISGLNYSHVYTSDEKKWLDHNNSQLALIPPGFKLDFSFNQKRENFVLICNIPDLQYDLNEKLLKLPYGESVVTLYPQRMLDAVQRDYFRNIFERIIELRKVPLPANLFIADQLACSLISELLVNTNSAPAEHKDSEVIAQKFRQQLESDKQYKLSLQEHAELIGYSSGYLRRIFSQIYGIDPREYRLRRKQERIQMLLSIGMPLKEIAGEVGMKNVTHLHAFIKQRCGMTPGKLSKIIIR